MLFTRPWEILTGSSGSDPQISTAKRLQRAQIFNSSVSHANLERQLLAGQTTTSGLETKLREKELLVERLERDRRYFTDYEKEEREVKQQEREVYDQAKISTSGHSEHHTQLSATNSPIYKIPISRHHVQHPRRLPLKSRLAMLNHRVVFPKYELSQYQHISDERSRIVADLQAQYDELVSQKDGVMRFEAKQEGMGVVREELDRQAEYPGTLEAKNVNHTSELAYLREHNQRIEVLREEKRALETKLVSRLDELEGKVVKLEAEVEAGRLDREAWTSKTQGTNNNNATLSTMSISITRALTDLRLTQAHLLEEHGAPERLEVGYLQALLSKFKAEEAYGENKDATLVVDQVKLVKMEELEALLADYKNVKDQLANDLEAFQGPMVSTRELEKVEQERQVPRRSAFLLTPPSEGFEADGRTA
ncbi:hypothetical protein BKA70DRAFT_1447745 [Coprinopsis sp. MPI-PUGE-AT-0042]|nr:hypothetical protein BKA70DRAFT_1447745 [Coprinopsis sp. MPI-PUGE-AT-0042]